MTRQHVDPIILPTSNAHAGRLTKLSLQGNVNPISEADLQALVHAHPECLPVSEIDPIFKDPVSICTELSTPAGPIDNFLVTPSGLPVVVECKLWRNPEGRREVVGQILDYAKELSRWSSSDLQREVNRRLSSEGNALLEIVRAASPAIDEIEFNDSLTRNLRRGRFLLLILGDGIREGVEAISEYLQAHAGLHFSLGLVELPIYILPDGNKLVVPRILARTAIITRTVIAVPDGHELREDADRAIAVEIEPEEAARSEEWQRFWAEFLDQLKLDDPEQPIPKPARQSYLSFTLPAPNGSSWLAVYRNLLGNEVGVFLSSSRNSAGDYAMETIVHDWDEIRRKLGGTAKLTKTPDNRDRIIDSLHAGPLSQPDVRKVGFAWLSERVNRFVNVMRPQVRSAVADYQATRPP